MTAPRYIIREVDGSDDDVMETIDELHDVCFAGEAPRVTYDYGHWWIAYCAKEPVAFAGITPSTLGPGVGYLKRVGVVPWHRGKGLHARLTRVREQRAKRNGWTQIVTDTTDNVPSANNMIKAGYRLFSPEPWAFERSLYWRKTLQ